MSVEHIPGMLSYDQAPDFSSKRSAGAIELSHGDVGRNVLDAFLMRTAYVLSPDEQARSMNYSGFTERGGYLVHMFTDFTQNEIDKKYYVVTGNMGTGEIEERRVCGVEKTGPNQPLALGIYLDGENAGEEHILLTSSYFEYDPGGLGRVERLRSIEQLTQPSLGHLAIVHSA